MPFLLPPLAAMLVLAAMPATPSAADPQGMWLTEGKDAVLVIDRCGRRLCGRIVWVESPRDDRGLLRVDHNNPDPVKRARPICGLTIINSLRHAGDSTWDGYIYNPKDGETYSGSITVLSQDSLRVRAYSLFRLFGKSQTWTRLRDATLDRLQYECLDGRQAVRAERDAAGPPVGARSRQAR